MFRSPPPLKPATRASKRGFTLIELSIVLVIIGLVIGGVLVGQDLISAAKVRAQVSQLENYNSAVQTFKLKYSALPGDMTPTNATAFGFQSRGGQTGNGDGNGLVSGYLYTGLMTTAICGETSLFWNDLSTAKLISGGSFTGVGGGFTTCDTNAIYNMKTVLPALALTGSGFIIAYTAQTGGQWYGLAGSLANPAAVSGADATNGHYGSNAAAPSAFSPLMAFALDSKIDDGLPLTGNVFAAPLYTGGSYSLYPYFTGGSAYSPAAPAEGICVSNASGNPYNLSTATGGSSISCSLKIKAGF